MKYSKNFKFFLEHQIWIARTNNGRHLEFLSRLESHCFKTISGGIKFDDEKIHEICYAIHSTLDYYDDYQIDGDCYILDADNNKRYGKIVKITEEYVWVTFETDEAMGYPIEEVYSDKHKCVPNNIIQ